MKQLKFRLPAQDLLPGEIILDLFAGGGGASHGIEIALGRSPDIAINHDPAAIAMHSLNHPATRHYREDVWKARIQDLVGGRPVGLMWASPDCFPCGTLVTATGGQKPIEDLRDGDLVLTHKGRWRRVTSTLRREAETVSVRGHGHYGLVTTPTHLFYSKRITTRYPVIRNPETGARQQPIRKVENPIWPAAAQMAGKLWATPRTFPALPIPMCKGAELSPAFFYFVGRWLGDGSINKGDVEICCGNTEFPAFLAHLESSPLRDADGEVVPFRIVDHGSSKLVVWGSAELMRWLTENFGAGCEYKRVPTWCLSMQRDWRRELLKGYLKADGYDGLLRVETKTVNKNLAISFRLLATTLGHAPSLYVQEGRPGNIEGRSFLGQKTYSVRWTRNLMHETVWTDTLHLYSPVREVTPSGVQTVISLQIEEDESFVADGIVVHNCRHFSRAKGGKPVSKRVRSLASVVVKYAKQVRPRVICLENVPEFLTWGPLGPDNMPIKAREGEYFAQWKHSLERLGYVVEKKALNAADYGAPTARKRIFVVARCDGRPVRWPVPSHGLGRGMAYRTAAECIDRKIPCPSIFGRKRPLAEATLRRLARGVKKYVVEEPEPSIVAIAHGEDGSRREYSVQEPLRTQTRSNQFALAAPTLTHIGIARRNGRGPRALILKAPLGAVTNGERTSLSAVNVLKFFGTSIGSRVTEPLPTITRGGQHLALVAGNLLHFYSSGGQDQRLDEPMHTIPTKARHALVETTLGGDLASAFRVARFLMRHGDCMPTAWVRVGRRFRPVVVVRHWEAYYLLTDLGLRMLKPRELATAQGFPPEYALVGTQEEQVAKIGNSVCPPVAAALVAANLLEAETLARAAMA